LPLAEGYSAALAIKRKNSTLQYIELNGDTSKTFGSQVYQEY
jgi:hypothetical protein